MKKVLFFLLSASLFWACSDDEPTKETDETDDPVEAAGCRIESIESTWSYSGGESEVDEFTFTYDNAGQVIKITETETYTSGGETVIDESEIQLTYSGGKIVSFKTIYDGGDDVENYTVTYTGDLLSKVATTYEYEGVTFINEFRFSYSGSTPQKLEYWSNEAYDEETNEYYASDELMLEDVETFTFSNGNLTKLVSSDEDYSSDYTFTYDDKTNPLKGNLAWLFIQGEFYQYFSENNVISEKEVYTYMGDSETYTTSSAYTFNDKGLVTGVTVTDSDGDQSTHAVNYDCE